jgi:hypothetical protein
VVESVVRAWECVQIDIAGLDLGLEREGWFLLHCVLLSTFVYELTLELTLIFPLSGSPAITFVLILRD